MKEGIAAKGVAAISFFDFDFIKGFEVPVAGACKGTIKTIAWIKG